MSSSSHNYGGLPAENQGLQHNEYMGNSNLFMHILSPDNGLADLSPSKMLLAEKIPLPHQSILVSPNSNSNVFNDDHLLLQSLDGNLYDHSPSTISGNNDLSVNHHLKTDFQLDSIDFIVPDDLGEESRAFPPLNLPQNTPSLLAHGRVGMVRNLLAGKIQLPILPSQNETSYNQEHLFHKQRQQRHQSLLPQVNLAPPKHIRPDAVFTPLVSPAGTPLDQAISTSNISGMASLREFEPLTSPALKAQSQNSMPRLVHRPSLLSIPSSDRLRPLSALGTDDYTSGSSAKRKTPHLTPNLQAHTASKLKLPLLGKGSLGFDKLPDASFDDKSSESTPMLPPQGKRIPIEHSSSSTPGSVGPGTMMGFTMNRLAEQQSSVHDTPTGIKQQKPPRRLSRTSSQKSVDFHGKQGGSSLSETSPMLEAQQDGAEYLALRNGKLPTKKTSHKLAEQGRRNRMNHAIGELLCLIPPEFHERAQIPSKATTVELASQYITTLLKEIEELKHRKNMRDK